MAVQGEAEQSDYRHAARDIKEGLERMVPAARTRANAVYYGFIVLSLGLIVMVRPHQLCIASSKIQTLWGVVDVDGCSSSSSRRCAPVCDALVHAVSSSKLCVYVPNP